MKYLSLALLLIINSFAFSQVSPTGVIRGTITDKTTGETVPFVEVTLKNAAMFHQTVLSDVNGFYSFEGLKPDTYTLTIKCLDCVQPPAVNLKLEAGKTIDHAIRLDFSATDIQEVIILSESKTRSTTVQRSYMSQGAVSGGFSANYNSGGKGRGIGTDGESYDDFTENSLKAVSDQPLSTFSIDVDKASYSNIRRFINHGSLPPPDAVRIEEMINYFSYDYPSPTGKDPVSITTEYTSCPWNAKRNLLYIGVKGKTIDLGSAPANNLVFLIDVSGSMASADKLELLKSGLYLLVDQMREQDKVSIVVYAGAAGVVLKATSGYEKEKIKCVIENLSAGGSTAGGEGIELAYKLAKDEFIQGGNNRVLLATDGDFNVGISDEGALVRLIEQKREAGIYLTVLGFGSGNLQDSKMEKLADKGNGNYAYIDNILEAKKVLLSEMGGTLITTAKDVKLQVEFNPANVKAYRLVGYENRMLASEDFNDDKKDAGDLGSGHSVTAVYEIVPAGSDEVIPSVDSLKYQRAAVPVETASAQNDIATVKLRYKEPTDATSQLMSHVAENTLKPLSSANENFRFAAVVIEFGLLLRNSEHKAGASYEHVLSALKSSTGKDADGSRKELAGLVEKASKMEK